MDSDHASYGHQENFGYGHCGIVARWPIGAADTGRATSDDRAPRGGWSTARPASGEGSAAGGESVGLFDTPRE